MPSTTYLRSAWSNGAAVSLSCDVENPEERVLHRSLGRRHLLQGHDESSATRLLSEAVLLCINFSDESGFLEKLKMRTVEEKKDTELFLHVWFSKSNFDADRRCWRNVECFWSHRSRKEGLDNAGWSGRSYIVLLVVLVLNIDDGQMNGLSMLATMFSRLDVPNCDLVFLRLSSFRQDDTEDIFLSLFTVKTEA